MYKVKGQRELQGRKLGIYLFLCFSGEWLSRTSQPVASFPFLLHSVNLHSIIHSIFLLKFIQSYNSHEEIHYNWYQSQAPTTMGEGTRMNQMWESIAALKRSQEEQQITQAEQQKQLITVTQQLGALSDAVKLLGKQKLDQEGPGETSSRDLRYQHRESFNGEQHIIDRAEAETLAFQAEIIFCELISNSSEALNKIPMKGEAVNEEAVDEIDGDDQCEILELDAKESLFKHIQFYEICGKGFHRDVKLVKRIRAHENQLTTPEALAMLPSYVETKKTRFSRPSQGCNHIKSHYLVLGLISLMKSSAGVSKASSMGAFEMSSFKGPPIMDFLQGSKPLPVSGKRFPPEVEVLYVGSLKAEIKPAEQEEVTQFLLKKVGCMPTFLSNEIQDKFYHGFYKHYLWPPFHYILPVSQIHDAQFNPSQWCAYVRANHIFANKILEVLNNPDEDFVLIHDYHLMAMSSYLQKKFHQVMIEFFLHSPFPASKIYRTLLMLEEILGSLLNSDLIGFHIFDYARHFLSCCSRTLSLDYESKGGYLGIEYFGQTVSSKILPVGIHMGQLESAMPLPEIVDKVKELKEQFKGRIVMLGVDGMAMFTGINLKFLAMRQLLAQKPGLEEKVVWVQIAKPASSRDKDIQEVENEIHLIAKEINKSSGKPENEPIVFVNRFVPTQEKIAYYAISKCCVMNDVRKGMNLVPYKYTVCRQGNLALDMGLGTDGSASLKKSVIIILEFVGSSPLPSSAIQANPWNIDCVLETMSLAITKDVTEKQWRHEKHSAADQEKVFLRPPYDIQKVIIATNIVETSITMDEMGFISSNLTYNNPMGLYTQTGMFERIPNMLSVMKENGFSPNNCSYRICNNSYGTGSDIENMAKLLEEMNFVRSSLEFAEGVNQVEMDMEGSAVTVSDDPNLTNPRSLLHYIQEAGRDTKRYNATLFHPPRQREREQEHEIQIYRDQFFWSCLFSVPVFVFSMVLPMLHPYGNWLDYMVYNMLTVGNPLLVSETYTDGQKETKLWVDVVGIAYTFIKKLSPNLHGSVIVSMGVGILAKILKCSRSHMTVVALKTNIFEVNLATNTFDVGCNVTRSALWLFSEKLATFLLIDREQNDSYCPLTTSLREFTMQLVETCVENDFVIALVIFSLQYVLVHHESWEYKAKDAGKWYHKWKEKFSSPCGQGAQKGKVLLRAETEEGRRR
ncbi:uncharacterized protein LOC131164332 [Malania oleifera]|uniref:uncharacterized protein LOC131164332 n=1 Tax=Malania oleifera TaxID=397392 RepID=UPI0025AE788C|nr:uncharacterized protein LOC131164332 [Malania oleifera]